MEYLQELLRWMGTTEVENIIAGLTSFIIILEKSDHSIYPLAPKLLSALFQIFT